jgi:predicted DNA-binding transcriptional regulator AlpA
MNVAAAKKQKRVEFTQAAIAVSISEAAHMVGISRAHFYNLYIGPGRVKPVVMGGHSRVIDVGELRAAYEKIRAETRKTEQERDT